jgi:hypothetical protein
VWCSFEKVEKIQEIMVLFVEKLAKLFADYT